MQSEIKISNHSGITVIDIEGVIGVPERMQFEHPGDRIATYEKFTETLREITSLDAEQVLVNIRSSGGDVNDALLIYDALTGLKAAVTTRCYGYVASAATIIAQAASSGRRQISPNSLYLIHCSESAAEGNKHAMMQTRQLLDETDHRIAAIYAASSGRPVSGFIELMNANNGKGRWMSASETLAVGLADSVAPVRHGNFAGGKYCTDNFIDREHPAGNLGDEECRSDDFGCDEYSASDFSDEASDFGDEKYRREFDMLMDILGLPSPPRTTEGIMAGRNPISTERDAAKLPDPQCITEDEGNSPSILQTARVGGRPKVGGLQKKGFTRELLWKTVRLWRLLRETLHSARIERDFKGNQNDGDAAVYSTDFPTISDHMHSSPPTPPISDSARPAPPPSTISDNMRPAPSPAITPDDAWPSPLSPTVSDNALSTPLPQAVHDDAPLTSSHPPVPDNAQPAPPSATLSDDVLSAPFPQAVPDNMQPASPLTFTPDDARPSLLSPTVPDNTPPAPPSLTIEDNGRLAGDRCRVVDKSVVLETPSKQSSARSTSTKPKEDPSPGGYMRTPNEQAYDSDVQNIKKQNNNKSFNF